MESREVSWAWVTADRLLHQGACELIFAFLVVSAASSDTHLYNGENTLGEKVATLEAAVATGQPFDPPVPIYCPKGLYIDIGSSVTGVLVMWRGL